MLIKKKDTIENKIDKFYLIEVIFWRVIIGLFAGILVSIILMNYLTSASVYFEFSGCCGIVFFILFCLVLGINYFRVRICPKCNIEMEKIKENDTVLAKCRKCGFRVDLHTSFT
ncbi:MAG: hypothetical protein PF637_07180 [Spirochaetes bacterium]|jgi:uncharacterized protein YacL|nr:hypothetical protein [Spirochaetota bacterium]